MELPANRAFFFVAMDHEGWPVKRMHSFTSVMPGEVTACIGCHEQRTEAPPAIPFRSTQSALQRAPSRPMPVPGIPDVFDFVRDIQPILDRHCIECHNNEHAEADIVLVGDWTPRFTQSYEILARRQMFGDNRNRPISNFMPYEIGSFASSLMQKIDGGHGGVAFSDHDRKMIRFWLETGATYAGTYAANAQGRIGLRHGGSMDDNAWFRNDLEWAETLAMTEAIARRCDICHGEGLTLPHTASHLHRRFEAHRMFNFTNPEQSRILTAPLAKSAGGLQLCQGVVFADRDDPDYQTILAGIERARQYMLHKRPNSTPFFANRFYVREMIRYGILPLDHDYATMPICPFATDQQYWESLWFVPQVR
jgi:hypothetical protein